MTTKLNRQDCLFYQALGKNLSDKTASAYEGKSFQFSLHEQIHFVMVSEVTSSRFSDFCKRLISKEDGGALMTNDY